MNVEVTQNENENRFEVWVEGQLSKLDYNQNNDTIVLTHVGVHPNQRGQGIAAKLAQAGLEYAREKNLRVIPMCSYVAAYIRKHPEYMELTQAKN